MKKRRRIIEIRQQVRNSSRRTVILDDGSVFGISEDVLLLTDLGVGDELTDEDLGRIQEKEDTSKVMNAALHLLEFRMRSITELRQRLLQKGYERDKIAITIEKLTGMGYLDDSKFALAFARDKVRSRRIGPVLLKQELGRHNLGQEIEDLTLDIVYKEFSVDDCIENHIIKKIPDMAKANLKDVNRVKIFLQRKGFTWDQIRDHLSRIKESISNND